MSNLGISDNFLSTEQRRTVDEAIGVLEQLRSSTNSPNLTATFRASPAENRSRIFGAGERRGTPAISTLPKVHDDRPSGSGLQSLRIQNRS